MKRGPNTPKPPAWGLTATRPGAKPRAMHQMPAILRRAFQALGRIKAGAMNRTEAEYAGMLELRKRAGEIAWYRFDAISIRLADRTFYKPDFLVMLADGRLEVHEVKGGFVTDDGAVKLKVASELFPAQFFRAQKAKKVWTVEPV